MSKNVKPLKETLTPLKGCKAVIYQHELSKNWWVRCRIDGRYVIRSTGETEKREALKKAESIYLGLLKDDQPIDGSRRVKRHGFSAVALSMNEKTKCCFASKTDPRVRFRCKLTPMGVRYSFGSSSEGCEAKTHAFSWRSVE